MADLLTVANFTTLIMLTLLQAVLGFDNLLYISIESKRVAASKQRIVRKAGIGIAIALRIVLLFVVMTAIDKLKTPWVSIHWEGVLEGEFNFHSIIVLAGGVFIIYTAMKEIFHMLSLHDVGEGQHDSKRSVGLAITWIVVMNLVFSFDSILSALALTHVFPVMAGAIVVSGLLMIWLADHVSIFLQKNRLYEVLGLFILFIVGIMLVSEGGHLAHLSLFGHHVVAMTKSTFYFVLVILILTDIVQSRYQRKLMAEQASRQGVKPAATKLPSHS